MSKLIEKSTVKQIAKLQKIIERRSGGEIVQNRQLKTVLGTEGYARYLSDCEYQRYLRAMLRDKPDEIVEYERRLKVATFAYSKADYRSQKGHRSAKKMFGASDKQFERLSEYLSENIIGHPELEVWFDRLSLPIFTWSMFMFMFRKRRTTNFKQASEAGGYYHKVAAS
ncbi:hypothetical protein N8307_09280 [Planktomarina temperata]|nr:hypothetical protein [Planktomarina temperata]